MTNYREILRLSALGLSQSDIARSCNAIVVPLSRPLIKQI